MGRMGLTVRRDSRRRSSRSIVARLARTGALALVGGCLLMAVFVIQQGAQGALPAALACGLGQPQTMLANKIPALLYPVTPDMPQNAPQGVFPLDYTAGASVAFTEDLSRVPGAPKLSSFRWQWNFGDGTGNVNIESPSHTFTKPGTYYVGSWIWDTTSDNWTSFDSAQIHIVGSIPGNPPVAKATSNMGVTLIGQNVTFDATGSRASDGSQLKYLWNFNDGTTATTPHVEHAFPLNGTTFAALVVTDDHGAQSMATVNITIQTQAPTAALSASDLEVDAGSTISFDASQSAPPQGVAGEAVVKYVWDFGDGTKQQTTQTPTTSHTYEKAGSYKVALTVYDKQSEQASTTLQVKVLGTASGGVSPLVIIGGIALLIGLGIAVYAFWQQRRRAEMVRRYQQEQALARARRSQRGPRGPNSGNGYYGGNGNGRQPAMRGGPPRYDRSSATGQTGQTGQRRPPPSNGSLHGSSGGYGSGADAGYGPRDPRSSSSPNRPPRRQSNPGNRGNQGTPPEGW
jgi:PKD repeat protein